MQHINLTYWGFRSELALLRSFRRSRLMSRIEHGHPLVRYRRWCGCYKGTLCVSKLKRGPAKALTKLNAPSGSAI